MSGIFTIDVVGVLHLDCIGRANFKTQLLASTLGPLAIAAVDMLYQAGRVALFGGAYFDGKAFKW